MTINISLPEGQSNLRPRITVVGVGGAGGNAVNNMINSNLEGVDFLVANTDAQALENSFCEKKVQLGLTITKGLGAGMRPDIGKTAAEEAHKDVESKLAGSNMAFIAAGMGGGTGTGAAPVIAKLARENGILTVGVVTKPFHFEGMQRMRLADKGIEELEQYVDTLIIIPNQNLFRIANEKTGFAEAFKMADDVLYAGVRGVTDLMVMPGLINLDFSDVKTVMSEMGKAMMGTGEAQGENRAVGAAEAAIANPLIDDVSLKGAKGLIINITGGKDLTLYEVDEAANRIREEVDVDANIIFGSTCDDRLEGVMRVSIVATGIEGATTVSQKRTPEVQAIRINNSVYKKPIPKFVSSHFSPPLKETANPSLENNQSFLKQEPINSNVNNENHETQDIPIAVNENDHLGNIEHHENHNNESVRDQDDKLNLNQNETKVTNEFSDINDLSEEEIKKEDLEPKEINTEHENSAKENLDISENPNARRLSLFDNFDENKSHGSDERTKKEPVLNHISKAIDESEDLDNDFNQDFTDETSESYEEQASEEEEKEASQDDELLDIPTFLRRQAN